MSGQLLSRIRRHKHDDGMTSAEYAVGTAAAVAFAMILLAVAQNSQVLNLILHIFTSALTLGLK